jgi:hypothetical protein
MMYSIVPPSCPAHSALALVSNEVPKWGTIRRQWIMGGNANFSFINITSKGDIRDHPDIHRGTWNLGRRDRLRCLDVRERAISFCHGFLERITTDWSKVA